MDIGEQNFMYMSTLYHFSSSIRDLKFVLIKIKNNLGFV